MQKLVDKLRIGCYYKFNNKTTETQTTKRSKEPVLKGNSSSESKI